MIETRAKVIQRLIDDNTAALELLVEQQRSFEQMHGIGSDGRDLTEQWKQKLSEWIEERKSLITDLEAVRAGTRDTI